MTAIRDALTPLTERMRSGQATVEPVSQVLLSIAARDGKSSVDAGIDAVMPFIRERAGGALPEEAMCGRSFSLDEIGARRIDGVAIDEPRYWAVRFDDEDKVVAQRSWVIETALADLGDGTARFGMRLQCIARAENPPYVRSVPSFVRDVVEKCEARLDGRRISIKPWLVDDEASVDSLVTLLESSGRTADVIAVSLPEGETDPKAALLHADGLARDLAGAAHVAVITGDATFMLSDRVGKEFSVFQAAVRTYRPGFDPATEEPFAHPLALRQRIESWNGGPDGYRRFIISNVLERTVSVRDAQKRMPSFAEVKRTAAALRRQAARSEGSSSDELLALAEQEIAELKGELEAFTSEANGQLVVADAERDEARAEAEQLRQMIFHMRQRLDAQANAGPVPAESDAVPDDLSSLGEWADRHLAGAVDLHNRAIGAAKKSIYEDPTLIYRALLLLRDAYVPMKREGGLERKEAFENGLRQLGLEESASFSGTRAGEQGDSYIVRVGTRKFYLDRHLKKGSTKNDRLCFRLYFTWDDVLNVVVVGWLPSHLPTRIT